MESYALLKSKRSVVVAENEIAATLHANLSI